MEKVTLFINPVENKPGEYHVVVEGEGFFESDGKKVGARIRGDDPLFDDHLFGIGGIGGISERVRGGRFVLSKIVHSSVLNEDWWGRDEIYALVDVEGSGTYESNKIKDYF